MNIDDRLTYLNTTIAAIEHTWPHVQPELQARIDDLTLKLISDDDEQARGAIKELRRVLGILDMLTSERDHIAASMDE